MKFLTNKFNEKCRGNYKCEVDFLQTALPSKCNLPYASALNWQYVLVATCKDDTINLFNKKLVIGKEEVASIVVIFDLIICFFFWFAILSMRTFQKVVSFEMNTLHVDP